MAKLRGVVLTALVFLTGIVVVYLAIFRYPALIQYRNIQIRARSIANFIEKEGDNYLAVMHSSDKTICIFDREGNVVRLLHPKSMSGEANENAAQNSFELNSLELESVDQTYPEWESFERQAAQKLIAKVLNGSEASLYNLLPVSMRTKGILVAAGVPVWKNGGITGGVLVYGRYPMLFNWFVFAIVSYVVLFVLIYVVLLYIRDSRRRQAELNEVKQNYIDHVFHALKTPVTSIRAMAEVLCEEAVPTPEKQQLYCRRILLEAKKQDRMIHEILELSELRSRKKDVTRENVSVRECFGTVLDKYVDLCDCMELSLHIADNIWKLPRLHTNPACIQEVLSILLDNAIKFTKEGEIWVEAGLSASKATIRVRDSGIGIDPKRMPYLFDRFFTYTPPGVESGSGLGLAIAKEMLDSLEEKIWAESQSGRGSVFSFTLQLAKTG